MNGRVYDPVLSRFLSPDPYIQAPELALNYNRYTYCMNNPMLYTDESGEIFGFIVKAIGWWVINTVANAINNDVSLKESAKNTPIIFSTNIDLPQKVDVNVEIDDYKPVSMPKMKWDYELFPFEIDLRLPQPQLEVSNKLFPLSYIGNGYYPGSNSIYNTSVGGYYTHNYNRKSAISNGLYIPNFSNENKSNIPYKEYMYLTYDISLSVLLTVYEVTFGTLIFTTDEFLNEQFPFSQPN